MTKDKTIYTMDVFPSPESFGWTGFILCVASIVFAAWLFISYGLMALIAGVLIFTFGGFAGREFENIHHKQVMAHLPKEIQDLYNKTAKDLVKKDLEKHDIKHRDSTG